MHLVDVGNQDGRCQHEQQNVPYQEVRAPQRELNDLDKEFSSWLRHDVHAEVPSVPPSSPPSLVGLVVFELSGQKNRDQDLVDGTLDENHGNKTEDGVRSIPKF